MDPTPTAAHEENTKQLHQPDDCMAHVHTLLDDYVVHGRRLRALHAHYLALLHAGLSYEQRREAYRRILHTELDVLAEARCIQQTMQALLNEHRSHLRAGT